MSQPQNNRKLLLLGVSGLALIGLGYYFTQSYYYVTTENAQVQARTVILSARVLGQVSQVNVVENQKVKMGEILAELDDRQYRNQLLELETEKSHIESQLRASESDGKKTAIPFPELKKRLAHLHSQLAQAQLNLEYTQLKAPSQGVVARKSAEVGMLASVGTPLFGFVGSEDRWVMANFKETEVSQIKLGARVEVWVDAIPQRVFEGVVESKGVATGATFALLPPDNATGNFTKVVQRIPIRIRLARLNQEDVDELRAGLSASVRVRIR